MYVNVFIQRTYHAMHATNDAESTMVLVKKTCGSLGERQFEQVGRKLGLLGLAWIGSGTQG